MIHAHSAGGIIVNTEGKIAIAQQDNDTWSLPKGHIDAGEDILAAAKREIYEETGLKNLTLIKSLGSFERDGFTYDANRSMVRGHKTIHLFLFTTIETLLQPVDPQNPKAVWLTPDEAVARLTHKKDKEFFKSIISEIEKITS